MINILKWATPALFCLSLSLGAGVAHAQDSTVVDVNMPCGVAGTPPCKVEADTSGLPSAALSASDASLSPDFSIISIAAPSLSFAFPFQKVSCNQTAPTASLAGGRSVTLSVDYCKVAGVVNDVASILAYVLTAGYLINLAFRPRGE